MEENNNEYSTNASETIIKCPACNAEYTSPQKFCANCGANMETKRCPECGAECAKEQKFCEECGYNMNMKKCPDCGKECELEQAFCTGCGYKFDNTSEKITEDKKSLSNTSIIFISVLIFVFIVIIGIAIFLHYNSSISQQDEGVTPNCEASEVKDLVISIFNDNNEYIKAIDKSSIASVILRFPAVSGYDKSLDKYFCTGEVVVESNPSGLLPLTMEYENKYYSKIAHDYYYDSDESYWERYTTYVVPVEYTSQTSEGSTLVTLKQKRNNETFSTNNGSDRMDSRKPKRIPYANFNSSNQNSYSHTETTREENYNQEAENDLF
ncbi:MAG: zinc ribbon domain-containing protein [Candidatus Gastranaerophilales bacterium]|nr:zinc ribbon domain-containing protein [Candidatus Gastranaerophilales bacterium]